MKRAVLAVFFWMLIIVGVAEAAPIITLTVDGGEKAIVSTSKVVAVRFGLIADGLAGKAVQIVITRTTETEAPDNISSFYPRAVSNWALSSGNWVEGAKIFSVPAKTATSPAGTTLVDIPLTVIRNSKFVEGVNIFKVTIKDVATGTYYSKTAMVYAYKNASIKLLSSEKQTDGRWKYNMGLPISAITGDRTAPVIAGDFNGWTDVALKDTNSDGFYEFNVTSFTDTLGFSWAGNKAKNSWPNSWIGGYKDALSGSDMVTLHEGMMFRPGRAPVTIPTGTGDGIVRIAINQASGAATVCNNLSEVYPANTDSPFYMDQTTNWAPTAFNNVSSTGWGCFLTIGIQPYKIEWVAGGKHPVSWLKNTNMFYKAAAQKNCAYVSGGKVTTCP